MAYRIVSIENPAEVHVRNSQLVVEQDSGTVYIPVRDIMVLVVCGPNIRMSTYAQTILASNKVAILFLGRNHHPAAILLPTIGYARQSKVLHAQVSLDLQTQALLWQRIVIRKIENQARALDLLGLKGSDVLLSCAKTVEPGDSTNREGDAAKRYFQFLQPGLNRRVDDPLNSVLNYGYAIVRAVVAREVTCAGFVTGLGLHHHSQLNPFNLVDDLMEPLRPCIDIYAVGIASKSIRLSRKQRAKLRRATNLAVRIEETTLPIISAARRQALSLRDAILKKDCNLLQLPVILSPALLDIVGD